MACVSRPKPPSFWSQLTIMIILLSSTKVDSGAQLDIPEDNLYLDPRYSYTQSPPTYQGPRNQDQGRSNDRSFGQGVDPYTQGNFPANHKPVKELNLDEALNTFLKTQDPKYYKYYQNGDSRQNPGSTGTFGGQGFGQGLSRGSPQGNQGTFQGGSQGGYQGSQGGYQGSQGGYQGSQGGYQGSQGGSIGGPGASDPQIAALLKQIDYVGSQQCSANVLAQWNFETNVNEVTQLEALRAQLAYSEFQSRVRTLVSKIEPLSVGDPQLWRQLRHLSVIGPAALPLDQLERYNRVINDMLEIYNSATICAYNEPLRCGLRLEPDLQRIMSHSHDWDELQHTWVEWNRRSGMKLRDLYEQLVDLSNYAARLNNFTDFAEYWQFPYEAASFRFDLEDVWEEIRPLYEQLHAYVRRKLRDLYGPEKISRQAPLPAHILGNMWAQSWSNILDETIPYPGKNFLDVTTEMHKQGYAPGTMFRLAEEFYVSLNMSALPPEFWTHSILQELPDRRIICQPSAWDFCNGRDYRVGLQKVIVIVPKPDKSVRLCADYKVTLNPQLQDTHYPIPRIKDLFNKLNGGKYYCVIKKGVFTPNTIKMCTQVTMQDLITAHHEMAHIQYFMAYRDQPKVFRDGANPGFHEAISEAVSLSVTTPHHLQTLGLVLRSVDDVPHNINYLYSMALDKVAFLPFALALDFWRWDIFQGNTPRERYNCHWWDLRERLSGIKPPVLRSETDFDPGSKYHVPANIPYIRYFVGTVLQFQIHRALCKAAAKSEHNHAYNQPLHKCDIYRSKEAGEVLKKLMAGGSSLPWSEALYQATGETRLDGSALRQYFQPLEEWLRNENLRTQEYVGWNYDGDYCKYSIETANLQVYGGFYNAAFRVTNSFVYVIISTTLAVGLAMF